jgi:hypothetical protein
MLFSHTSPSLIDDIFLPAHWSPRSRFGTRFQKRITLVADRWKLSSRDYRWTRLRFLKPERKLPGLRTLKESANRPRIECNAALPEFCRDRQPRRPFFSQTFNLVKIRPEQALERLRMGRWFHGKRVMPTRTRRRNGHREEETERPHPKKGNSQCPTW